MTLSPKMLEILKKVHAARDELLSGLRESAKRDTEAKTLARMQARSVAKQRAAS
jgi:hypothetical protein